MCGCEISCKEVSFFKNMLRKLSFLHLTVDTAQTLHAI
jgi:hypothetical protein